MSLRLADDHMCYVCGTENSHGLRLHFDQPEKHRLTATVVFSKHHQGFKNIVHGGMIAMVLDEMMVNLAWKEGVPAVTAEITVRLKKPTLIGQKVLLEGYLKSIEGRVIQAQASAKDENGELLASAKATCVRIKEGLQSP